MTPCVSIIISSFTIIWSPFLGDVVLRLTRPAFFLHAARIEVQTVVARLESQERDSEKMQSEAEKTTAYTARGLAATSTSSSLSSPDKEEEEAAAIVDEDDNPELLACFQRVWSRGELYKGVGPLTWTLAISNFVFFFVNSLVKKRMLARYRNNNETIPPSLSLLASCLAGSINVLLTNPIWVTNLRIISNQAIHASLPQEMLHVARTLGPSHLWQGTNASLLLVSNPVIQFFCYERIKAFRLRRRKPNLSPVEAFFFGALAKAIATIITYPLQLAQAVLRMQKKNCIVESYSKDGDNDNNHVVGDETKKSRQAINSNMGTLQCLMNIYARDGYRGLYTGIRAKLLQTVLTAAFTFLSYEQILAAVYSVQRKIVLNKRHKLART